MTLGGSCMCANSRLTGKAFTSAQPHQRATPRVVICTAQQSKSTDSSVTSRRAALSTLTLIPAALIAPRAWALIPDDDDENLVELAKSRRSQKLKAELGTEKKFVRSEGFQDASLVPVQKAVLELAMVGSQLSGGDLGAVQDTLNGSWFSDLDASAKTSPDWTDFTPVCKSIVAVRDAAKDGNLPVSKAKYILAVAQLQSWTKEAGIAASLKGL